ncbi:MAG: glycoside hydrolase family 2, partial [Clostridia bacterium]|nr:glycoside hydrolase family 2 [Clostridia bacterium]
KEHMFSNKMFGYRVFKTTVALAEGFAKLYEKSILPLVDKGLSATVYTQVSDVEEEINGLVTYDRKVVKFPLKLMKSLNDKLTIKD